MQSDKTFNHVLALLVFFQLYFLDYNFATVYLSLK